MSTYLVVLNFEHLKPVKVTPWLIKGTALDCVSKLLWMSSEEMLRTCSCFQIRLCVPLLSNRGVFIHHFCSLWQCLAYPQLGCYISTLSFISLCVWGVTFPCWSTSGTWQASLPGQSFKMQSSSDKGDPMDPNNILDGEVSSLKPPTS